MLEELQKPARKLIALSLWQTLISVQQMSCGIRQLRAREMLGSPGESRSLEVLLGTGHKSELRKILVWQFRFYCASLLKPLVLTEGKSC